MTTADAAYNGSTAITVYAVEARNENAFRSLIRPTVQGVLTGVAQEYALQQAKQLGASSSIGQLLVAAPQVLTQPLWYTIDNLRPFDVPVYASFPLRSSILRANCWNLVQAQ